MPCFGTDIAEDEGGRLFIYTTICIGDMQIEHFFGWFLLPSIVDGTGSTLLEEVPVILLAVFRIARAAQ